MTENDKTTTAKVRITVDGVSDCDKMKAIRIQGWPLVVAFT